MAGRGRAGAGGRARPRSPRPGLPAPAAAEKTEDDLQIHSEGRATERGAVSGLLSSPDLGRESSRDRPCSVLLSLPFPGLRRENSMLILYSQPWWKLSLVLGSPAESVIRAILRLSCGLLLHELREWISRSTYCSHSAPGPTEDNSRMLQ